MRRRVKSKNCFSRSCRRRRRDHDALSVNHCCKTCQSIQITSRSFPTSDLRAKVSQYNDLAPKVEYLFVITIPSTLHGMLVENVLYGRFIFCRQLDEGGRCIFQCPILAPTEENVNYNASGAKSYSRRAWNRNDVVTKRGNPSDT